MEKKMVKREVINLMLADENVVKNEIYVSFLSHELELLNKKASSKKATKTQVENEGTKDVILSVLTSTGNPMTVTAIQKADVSLGELSNQKVSALLRRIKDAGVVDKKSDKKTTLYFAV